MIGTPGGAEERELLPTASAREAVDELRVILAGHRLLATGVVSASVAGAALSLIPIFALGRIVDAVREGRGTEVLVTLAVVTVSAAVAGGLISAAADAMIGTLAARVMGTLREKVTGAVLALPQGVVEKAGAGDALSRVGTDVAVLSSGARTALPALFSSGVLVAVAVVGLTTLDWRLALAGAAALPMYHLALRWYLPRSSPRYRELRVAEARYLDEVVTSVEGLPTIRSHGLEAGRRAVIGTAAADVRDRSISAFRVFSRFVGRENRAEFLGLSLLILAGWGGIRLGVVSVGEAAAALLLFHRLFNPLGAILFSADEAQRSGAALVRIVGAIRGAGGSLPEDRLRPTPGAVEVALRGVGHRYPGAAHPALDGVDLVLAPGETVALVGTSGAGKSTVAALVAGTLGADGVTVGGLRPRDLTDARLRGLVTIATQDGYVFAGTLAENLRLARPEADDEDLARALRAVGAAEWAEALPEGLDTLLGGGGLDIGPLRAQQLSLARLLLADTPVVVLDESTAEAGSRGAVELESAARAVSDGRTALVVAHRLEQAATADRVVVLESGRVVEEGTHAELLARGERYFRMWAAWGVPQSGGTAVGVEDRDE